MDPPLTQLPDIEVVDDKIAQQLQAIALMWGRGHSSLLGIVEKYYRIICAEEAGEIDARRRQIEVQKILRPIPQEMKDDVETAIKRVNELPRRRLTYVPAD